MRHLDIRGEGAALCKPNDALRRRELGLEVTSDVQEVDCEACLWRALQDVQNGLTVILQQLHKVTKANRVQVINPVAKKGFTDG